MVKAERRALQQWLVDLPGSWVGAMEATMFTGWIYDFLKPYAVELKVAHPAMLKAITAAKMRIPVMADMIPFDRGHLIQRKPDIHSSDPGQFFRRVATHCFSDYP